MTYFYKAEFKNKPRHKPLSLLYRSKIKLRKIDVEVDQEKKKRSRDNSGTMKC